MAAAAPIALALSVAGSLAGGLEANSAERSAGRTDEHNAQLNLLAGEQQSLQTRKDERMQAGDILASLGGAGVQLGTGTTSDLIAQSAYERELEILNIRTRAAREANNLYQSAADHRAAGRSALIQSVFSAASSAIKGVSDIRAARTLGAQRTTENTYMLGGGAFRDASRDPGSAGTVSGLPVPAPQMRVKGTL